MQVLLPTIENLLGTPEVQNSASRRSYQELATFAMSVFDASATVELNDTDKPLWGVYEKSLTTSLKTSKSIVPRTLTTSVETLMFP